MKFKSKIDWWIHLALGLIPAMTLWMFVDYASRGGRIHLITALIFTAISAFIVPIWFGTYYLLDGDVLLIKCGLFRGTRIACADILSVRETRSSLSSSALSADRLEIKYRKSTFNDIVLISPKDKEEFIRHLRAKNSGITIEPGTGRRSKAELIVMGFTLLVFAGVGALLVSGSMEPSVLVGSEGIDIRASFGLSVEFSEIESISLVDKTISAIGGGGLRTWGFGGIGPTLKGYFNSDTIRRHILFVRTDSSPTIHIERRGAQDIYISFKDGERTEQLYRELRAALPAN